MTDTTTATIQPKANDLAIASDPATWTITSSGNSWLATDQDGKTVAKAKTQRALRTTVADWQVQWNAAHPAPVVAEETIPTGTGDATPDPVVVADQDATAIVAATEETIPATETTEDAAPVVVVAETGTNATETRATTLEEQEAELAAMDAKPAPVVASGTVVAERAVNQTRKNETPAEADARLKAYRAAKKYKHSLLWQLIMTADIPEGMTVADARTMVNQMIAAAVPCDGASLSWRAECEAINAAADAAETTTTEEIPATVAGETTTETPALALVPDQDTTTEGEGEKIPA